MPIDPGVVEKVLERFSNDITESFADALSPASDPAVTIGLNEIVPSEPVLTQAELVAVSDALVAIPWSYNCIHTGVFVGIPATYITFELRGTTFVDPRDSNPHRWTYYRYVDFIGALHQIGVQTSVRPALTDEQYLNWFKETHAS